jgi:hypothetical protein
MGTSYPKETLISLTNSEKGKLQYRPRTYGTPCAPEKMTDDSYSNVIIFYKIFFLLELYHGDLKTIQAVKEAADDVGGLLTLK